MVKFNIKSIRLVRNISQEELALRVGCSQYYISKLENNNANPTIHILYKISKALNCCIKNLISCDCSSCKNKKDLEE